MKCPYGNWYKEMEQTILYIAHKNGMLSEPRGNENAC